MTRGMTVLLCAWAAGCSAHELAPALSLHAVLVLHQRARLERERGHDVAVTANLVLGGSRPRPGTRRERALSPLAAEAPACEESALCDWARMAEESALAALGVSP